MTKGRLIVLSGPSGVGKDTVLSELCKIHSGFEICITATTRTMRSGESEGNPYTFLSKTDFLQSVASGDFLEYAEVNGGNMYGTPLSWVNATLASGHDAILKIDVQGGQSVVERLPDTLRIFLAPPSLVELERRLRARGTETDTAIMVRLADAKNEIEASKHYDYIVINDDAKAAAAQLMNIMLAERKRYCPE